VTLGMVEEVAVVSVRHSALVEAARRNGVQDGAVLRAMLDVPRVAFVPPELAQDAVVDEPIPIACGQTTSQPSLVAMMLQALDLTGEERVLEIGTGLGYQAALLSRLARQVWTMEWFVELASQARANLQREGCANAVVVLGDGTQGFAEHAPYDAIVVACASPRVEPAWVEQLTQGGRLVVPVGPGGEEEVRRYVKHGAALSEGTVLTPARFVPLLGGRRERQHS
jgi:protein-L-isoaspartate(D-aspartate) O-methyltransferase